MLNIRRWVAHIRDNATLYLVAFYAVYGLFVYTFLDIGENDRFRGAVQPSYSVLTIAVVYQYLWKSVYRRRYWLFFGGLLIGWVIVAIVMDNPYLRKPAYTAPIQAEGNADGHVFGDREGIYPQADMPATQFTLGDDVQLAFTSNSFNNGMLTLEGVMTATSTPKQDYILFFHVLDINGRMVQQSDSLYLVDNWVTSALIPQRPIKFTRNIALPYVAGIGEYVVKFGAYTLPSKARLPLVNADGMRLPDDMGEWGRVMVIDE